MADIIKAHDDDVIFSKESLDEFIRLIQRQGIHNLYIYSVTDDLIGGGTNGGVGQNAGGYMNIYTRDTGSTNREFTWDEIKDHQGYFVIVRYSYKWQNPNTDSLINVKNKRHQYVKAIGTVNLFEKFGNTIENRTNVLKSTSHINGTFSAIIDSIQYDVKLRGFNNNGEYTGAFKPSGQNASVLLRGDGQWSNAIQNHFIPTANKTYNLGDTSHYWNNLYASTVNTTTVNATIVGATTVTATTLNGALNGNASSATKLQTSRTFTIGNTGRNFDGTANLSWSLADIGAASSGHTHNYVLKTGDTMSGDLIVNTNIKVNANNTSGGGLILSDDGDIVDNNNGYCSMRFSSGVIITAGKNNNTTKITLGSNGYIYADRVYNAVFNDYAECRPTISLSPGHVVLDNDDGTLSCSSKRLQPGAQVISDTYGSLMGETEFAKTPIAVAGRVLVYTYQPRENYHAGMAVCSAPNGTVDIMTREEIKNYPDCIIGIVSEIPSYEEWGTNKVKVNERIWIKVK